MKIELRSNTDCRSSKEYNQILSDNRAKAAVDCLISKGIDSSRLEGKGYGESNLLNHCECEGSIMKPCSEKQHQENRRTEFRIISIE